MNTDVTKEALIAFAKASAKIKNPTKNAKNPFLKNNYADLSAVIEVTKDTLSEHGFVVCQTCELILDGKGLRVCTDFIHESGSLVKTTCDVLLKEFSPQGTMGAFTYGRRYGLLAAFNLAAEDDDGNIASGKDENKTVEVKANLSRENAVAALKKNTGFAKEGGTI